jgi:hypothetical protein
MNVLVFITIIGTLYVVIRMTIGSKWSYGKDMLAYRGIIGWISTAGMLLGAFIATISSKILMGSPQFTELTIVGVVLFLLSFAIGLFEFKQ